jgi:hypothetical protein
MNEIYKYPRKDHERIKKQVKEKNHQVNGDKLRKINIRY